LPLQGKASGVLPSRQRMREIMAWVHCNGGAAAERERLHEARVQNGAHRAQCSARLRGARHRRRATARSRLADAFCGAARDDGLITAETGALICKARVRRFVEAAEPSGEGCSPRGMYFL